MLVSILLIEECLHIWVRKYFTAMLIDRTGIKKLSVKTAWYV